MSNLDESNKEESNPIKTERVIAILVTIVLVVVAFYFIHFNNGLAEKNDVWGQFGDYVGGILNPVIAAFAFYLIAETYKLQKRELEATRSLLEVSTEAQKDQITLAALTALLNYNLTRIGLLKTENFELLKDSSKKFTDIDTRDPEPLQEIYSNEFREKPEKLIMGNLDEIQHLTKKNIELEKQLQSYLGKQPQ